MYNNKKKLNSEKEGEIKYRLNIFQKSLYITFYYISRMETARARKNLCICADWFFFVSSRSTNKRKDFNYRANKKPGNIINEMNKNLLEFVLIEFEVYKKYLALS